MFWDSSALVPLLVPESQSATLACDAGRRAFSLCIRFGPPRRFSSPPRCCGAKSSHMPKGSYRWM